MKYKIAKREEKRVVVVAENSAYERLYKKLEHAAREKKTFKLARSRERRTRDLGSVRCLKMKAVKSQSRIPKYRKDRKATSISSLMKRGLISPNTLSKGVIRSNKTLGPANISLKRI